MTRPVSVLVVDDSPTMRRLITATLDADPGITVVGAAGDPYEAREAIKALAPDVITLDIEMPRMDGISFLDKIMRLRPTPVIMISTLTAKGASATIQALSLGAFDCVCKPESGRVDEAFARLPDLVRAAASSRIQSRAAGTDAAARSAASPLAEPNGNIVAIGSSTGGVEALTTVLSQFPENCPATVITQHMPEKFTQSLAARLDKLCAPRVAEAEDGAPLRPGHVYIAPGGKRHLTVERRGGLHCRLRESDPVNGHCPSVDVLFRSVAGAVAAKAVGVILTGMGKDGAAGLLEMRQAGASTLGQNEASCVVYGMPRAAREIGAVGKELPLSRIGEAALSLCDRQNRTRSVA